MNQRKRTQEKNKFSKLRLHSSSNKSGKSLSPRPQEKISSYFSSVLNETEINTNVANTSEDVSETVVTRLRNKKCVQKISTKISSELTAGSDTPDDLNDFSKPKILKLAKPIENKTSSIENLKKNVSKRKSQFASKPTVDYLENDTNQEHLQLAMAMSKSVLELENPQEAEIVENSYPSTQQKLTRVKQTLDQFGFKSDKSAQPSLRTSVKVTKGKKLKYFTPTLFLRTEAERTKLIESKVSQIINNISIFNNAIQENNVASTNNSDTKPRSFLLRDYYKEKPILFNKNALCMSDAQESTSIFYNSVVQPSNVEVGVLLKNWLTIPGREATPPLEDKVAPNEIAEKSVNHLHVQVPPIEISMSPELFSDSDIDDTADRNENIYNSSKGLLTSTDSITQIGKDKNVESYSSSKSVSLLEIKLNNHRNTSIINLAAVDKETVELSLSPFPEIPKPLNINTTKKVELPHNLKELNDENTDSLSPFEPVVIEKSPKRKVTPKKKSPSPKKYVVTPKGRKIISPNNQKRNSPCKRSILFTEKLHVEKPHLEKNHDDSIISKNTEICHFESFCNDSIECFDLTHSSDDEVLCMENDKNDITANKSLTVTQLLNELSPEKNTLSKETINEVQSPHDSQASIETIKLNIAKSYLDDEEFSPEFDCLNTSNNKVFYESLNNSLFSNNNDSLIALEKSSNNLSKNEAPNQIDLSNLDRTENEICNDEIFDNREICSTPKNIKNLEESTLATPSMNDELKYSFLSPNTKVGKKRNSSMFRRSHSENFIDDKSFQKESTPLSKHFRLSTADRELSRSVDEIEKSALNFTRNEVLLNFTTNEINENLFLSQSSISTCSDISDEELNYSCKSVYKRYDSPDKSISLSDEEDELVTSPTDNEKTLECDLQLHESVNDGAIDNNVHFHEPLNNSAIENNFSSINKSLRHPRVIKLSTPLKVNLLNHGEGKSSLDESIKSTCNVATPKTGVTINTENITPKGHYSDMETPEINRELEKFGLKPLKRNKGVKILHYIYDSTHPYVNESNNEKISNSSSDDESSKATKRRKTKSNEEISSINIPNKNVFFSDNLEQNSNLIAESENIEDMIFERKQSAKISSCRLPLHVAWNNLLISSKELQENILTYTPVQVEQIYEQFKSFGYKFHIQDLIAFLDKKCITIRIGQNSRHQKKVKSKK